MFVWRNRASAGWLAANEAALGEVAGHRLAIISKPAQKRAIAEIAGKNRHELENIRSHFGGTIEKLPRDWLARFSRAHAIKPIRIGKRLVIVSSNRSRIKSTSENRNKTTRLLIPAGRAFGTGEHATTAMTLRLLERCTRDWGAHPPSRAALRASRNALGKEFPTRRRKCHARRVRSPEKNWALLDLGTGSGILALAAKKLSAAGVIAIDHDPIAIATAKANARQNKIYDIDFKVADVRQWKFPRRIDIVTANLSNELLIEILPKLRRARWLILSGVLRRQKAELVCALKRNGIAIEETRSRGKWMAILGSARMLRA